MNSPTLDFQNRHLFLFDRGIRLLTYGYSQGGRVEDLKRFIADGAVVLDIRDVPTSPIPGWSRESLQATLCLGYDWCQALGNMNRFTNGPMKLRDPDAGMERLAQWLQCGPVVLLCGCADPAACHRTLAANEAMRRGLAENVLHLLPGQTLDGSPIPPPPGRIKAITLWQPWASAIAFGCKQVETRSWPVGYRGRIALHAAKKSLNSVESECGLGQFLEEPILPAFQEAFLRHGWEFLKDLPLGVVVATADLVDCQPTERIRGRLSPLELALGDFTTGRYGWMLENVRELPEPIPARGMQGVWEWEEPEGYGWTETIATPSARER